MANHDENGQPVRHFRAAHNVDRSIDELVGLCKGVAADGVVIQAEAEFICQWLKANDHVRDTWPANIIRARLAEYLEDGVLDSDERGDLFDLLRQVTGQFCETPTLNFSTALPFDQPLPALIFTGQRFCLTGGFAFGSRKHCELAIESLGGVITGAPAKKGCTLIVGIVGSRDWIHSTHGRKIETAVELRSSGYPVSIVPEDHWTACYVNELRPSVGGR